jgi:hypothetical protein
MINDITPAIATVINVPDTGELLGTYGKPIGISSYWMARIAKSLWVYIYLFVPE